MFWVSGEDGSDQLDGIQLQIRNILHEKRRHAQRRNLQHDLWEGHNNEVQSRLMLLINDLSQNNLLRM